MSTLASSSNPRPSPLDLPINVFNRQRRLPVDSAELKRYLERLAARLEVREAFSVVLLSDPAMRRYHFRFADNDYPTDVLSFPAGAGTGELGDILISVERAEAQRPDSLARELQRLALHGLLHLLGYDHESDDGRMAALERKLRGEFDLT